MVTSPWQNSNACCVRQVERFFYTAVAQDGSEHSAEIDALSQAAALGALRARGLTPTLVRPSSQHWWDRLNQPLDLGRSLPADELAFVTQQLSVLLSARLDLDEALSIAADQAESAKARRMLEALERRIKEGWTLTKALEENAKVPAFYIGIVSSAEKGGDLARAFSDLAQYLERSQEVAGKIKAALIYPAIVLIMVIVSLIVVLTLVIPRFEPVFQGMEDQLPLLTQGVLFASRSFNAHASVLMMLALALSGSMTMVLLNPRLKTQLDRRVLTMKGLGPILYQNDVAKVLRVLGTSLRNGVPLAPALDLSSKAAGNSFVRTVVTTAAKHTREGRSLSESFASVDGFPKTAKNLIRVGETSSQLPAMALKAAEILEHHSRTKTDRFIAILNPLATIGLGGIVAALVAGVMLGILSLSQIGL